MPRPKKQEVSQEYKKYAPAQPFIFNGEAWIIDQVLDSGLIIKPKSKKVSIAKDAFIPYTSIK